MKIDIDQLAVPGQKKVNLKHWPTRVQPIYGSEEDYQERLQDHVHRMSAWQELLYAHNRYALLLIFQAMDAAGKDGDDKPNGRLIISEILPRVLKSLKMGTLEPDEPRRRELLKIRKLLVKE